MKYWGEFFPNNGIINYLKNICNEIGKGTVFEFDSIGSDDDNVNFFVGAGTKYFPSKLMQIMKSITTRRTFREYFEIKTHL
jgi:putative transposase